MTIDRSSINIPKLVADIHAAERANRTGTWWMYARSVGCGGYVTHVTGLYTLRAWLRGKLHRQNPPAEIRDYNRSMLESGRAASVCHWDAREHNEKLATKVAEHYRVQPGEELQPQAAAV